MRYSFIISDNLDTLFMVLLAFFRWVSSLTYDMLILVFVLVFVLRSNLSAMDVKDFDLNYNGDSAQEKLANFKFANFKSVVNKII